MFKSFKNIFSPKALAFIAPFALIGCASKPIIPTDYKAFNAHYPHSILILPPVNHTDNKKADASLLSVMTQPLADGGYYVIPVGPMMESFKKSGQTDAANIQNLPMSQLRSQFHADAALYVTINRYETDYQLVNDVTKINLDARLVDLHTGTVLWEGSDSSHDGRYLLGVTPVTAVVVAARAIIAEENDKTHRIADRISERLLSPYSLERTKNHNSIPVGPYAQ